MSLRERIVEFLASIGLPVSTATLTGACFLPGVKIEAGSLLVDRDRLHYPGDLLHEAGHLAVLPSSIRPMFGDEHALPAVDLRQLEVQAIGWSYAAALHLALDPAVVFHEGGYRGHASGLLRSFAVGMYYGVSDLEAAGMTLGLRQAAELGVPPYPHMVRWLRE